MRWIVHAQDYSLMIILIIDENGISTFKPERQTPVSTDRDGPVVTQFATPRMQPQKLKYTFAPGNLVEMPNGARDHLIP
jgi:hypothetical protein